MSIDNNKEEPKFNIELEELQKFSNLVNKDICDIQKWISKKQITSRTYSSKLL